MYCDIWHAPKGSYKKITYNSLMKYFSYVIKKAWQWTLRNKTREAITSLFWPLKKRQFHHSRFSCLAPSSVVIFDMHICRSSKKNLPCNFSVTEGMEKVEERTPFYLKTRQEKIIYSISHNRISWTFYSRYCFFFLFHVRIWEDGFKNRLFRARRRYLRNIDFLFHPP